MNILIPFKGKHVLCWVWPLEIWILLHMNFLVFTSFPLMQPEVPTYVYLGLIYKDIFQLIPRPYFPLQFEALYSHTIYKGMHLKGFDPSRHFIET